MIHAAIMLILTLAILYIIYMAAHKIVSNQIVLYAIDAVLAIVGLVVLVRFLMIFI